MEAPIVSTPPDGAAGVLPLPQETSPQGTYPQGTFPHGPFLVEPDGALVARRVPALRFAWRGRPCEARLSDGRVSLTAGAGVVPYTAERAADRPGAFAAIGDMPADLPAGWRLRVLPDHRLRLEAEADLPAPTTAIALVGALVGFALALDPYLDRLESAGVAAGAVAGAVAGGAAMPGTAKT
jgi:hypothetical protein